MEKNTTASDEQLNTFFLAFVGECVEIVAMLDKEVTENSIKTTGYLLDYDDEYYFLGATPEEISHCVKRDRTTLIQILTEENVYTEILDAMEVPKNDQAKN